MLYDQDKGSSSQWLEMRHSEKLHDTSRSYTFLDLATFEKKNGDKTDRQYVSRQTSH